MTTPIFINTPSSVERIKPYEYREEIDGKRYLKEDKLHESYPKPITLIEIIESVLWVIVVLVIGMLFFRWIVIPVWTFIFW